MRAARHLVAVSVALSVAVPAAADSCARSIDSWGIVPLSSISVEKMDSIAKRTSECELQGDATCTYRDRSGITYRLVETAVESKELKVPAYGAKKPLPLGLLRTDTFETARVKLKAKYGLVLKLDAAAKDSAKITCADEMSWLVITFGPDGRISSIGSYVESMRD